MCAQGGVVLCEEVSLKFIGGYGRFAASTAKGFVCNVHFIVAAFVTRLLPDIPASQCWAWMKPVMWIQISITKQHSRRNAGNAHICVCQRKVGCK